LTLTWPSQLSAGQQQQQFHQSLLNPTIVIYSPEQQQPSVNLQEHQHNPPCALFFTANLTPDGTDE
jgi:hypothetical protein